jgi:hypothetical protein
MGFLPFRTTWRFYVYLKIKSGQWVVDQTKYWVARISRYRGPMERCILNLMDADNDPFTVIIVNFVYVPGLRHRILSFSPYMQTNKNTAEIIKEFIYLTFIDCNIVLSCKP